MRFGAACVSLLLLFSLSTPTYADDSSKKNKEFPEGKLPHLLYCLTTQLKDGRFDSSLADKNYFRIKYWYGIHDSCCDEPNELHLLILHKDGVTATLYELMLEKRAGRDYYYAVNIGIFKKNNGRYELEEAFGGLFTYRRLQLLVDDILKQPELRISRGRIRPGPTDCELH